MVAQVIKPKTDPYATTTTTASDGILWSKPVWSKPEKPKGKKARIRELERRIAELEAIVAKMPTITYTSPAVSQAEFESWWTNKPDAPWKYLSRGAC